MQLTDIASLLPQFLIPYYFLFFPNYKKYKYTHVQSKSFYLFTQQKSKALDICGAEKKYTRAHVRGCHSSTRTATCGIPSSGNSLWEYGVLKGSCPFLSIAKREQQSSPKITHAQPENAIQWWPVSLRILNIFHLLHSFIFSSDLTSRMSQYVSLYLIFLKKNMQKSYFFLEYIAKLFFIVKHLQKIVLKYKSNILPIYNSDCLAHLL